MKSRLGNTGQNWPFILSLLYSRYVTMSKEGQLLQANFGPFTKTQTPFYKT
ncbi:hypothetical protein F383_17240 [Gossypium arboreum]|uniref:Uncharacterized protein n=1 Tax=Gossypium arboreum TaxID=29729 RepID=A0A0B0NKK2_GOSAR|nr:hypothetical protein F383_17240 [Gossypium arboreum]